MAVASVQGMKAGLTKKVGPLPVWGYLLIGGAGLWWWYHNHQSAGDSGSSDGNLSSSGDLAPANGFSYGSGPIVPPVQGGGTKTFGWGGAVPGRKGYSYYTQHGSGKTVERKNTTRKVKPG